MPGSATVLKARWKAPGDVKRQFGTTVDLRAGQSSAIFDIGGIKYRLIGHVSYGFGRVSCIKFVGTHARIRSYQSRDGVIAKKIVWPLRSEADYETALADSEQYFEKEPKVGTPEADRCDRLALVIEDYEYKHGAIDPPDPIEGGSADRIKETGGLSPTAHLAAGAEIASACLRCAGLADVNSPCRRLVFAARHPPSSLAASRRR